MQLVDWMAFATAVIFLVVLIYNGTKDSFENELKREQRRFDKLVTVLVELDRDYANRDLIKKEIDNLNARIEVLKSMTRKRHHEKN